MSNDLLDQCIARMAARGFDKAQARLSLNERDEMQAEFNQPSMLRTVENRTLELIGIVADKRASTSLNKLSDDEIASAVDQLWESARAAVGDPANDIAQAQPHQTFSAGPLHGDLDKMCDRLDEFLQFSAATYPAITLGMAAVTHSRSLQTLINSNGVHFVSDNGHYNAQAMFTARDGEDVSSFSFSGVSLHDLDRPIAETATFDVLMRGATEQVRTRQIPDKFIGDLIITPDCLGSFLGFLLGSVSRGPMVADTSIYKGKIGEQVAANALTIRSEPQNLPAGYAVTPDGYPAENVTIVDQGMLKSYLLDLYAARKTGLPRALTGGGCYVVDAGERTLESMIGSVERGILISRFSGGRPGDNGEFSGVAKNSYYIENGAVQYPVSETMVSGNMAELLMNIKAISAERADFGSRVYPWVQVGGIGVS